MKSLIVLGMLALAGQVHAKEPAQLKAVATVNESATSASVPSGSARMSHRIGVYASLLSEPMGLLGVNAAYNVTDFLRLSAGFGITPGTSGTAVSMGTGVKLLVPGWSVSPMVGANFSFITATASTGTGSTMTGSGVVLFPTAGIDVTMDSGFHLGAGVQITGLATTTPVLPFLNIGSFF